MRISTLLDPPWRLLSISVTLYNCTEENTLLRWLVCNKLRLFMSEGMMSSCRPHLIDTNQHKSPHQKKIINRTFNPRPLLTASKVSRTWITRSLVGRTTSARRRVIIREESIYYTTIRDRRNIIHSVVPRLLVRRRQVSSHFLWALIHIHPSEDHTEDKEPALSDSKEGETEAARFELPWRV